MKGTRNDDGVCIYLADDMKLTEDQMLAAFGLVGMRKRRHANPAFPDGPPIAAQGFAIPDNIRAAEGLIAAGRYIK